MTAIPLLVAGAFTLAFAAAPPHVPYVRAGRWVRRMAETTPAG